MQFKYQCWTSSWISVSTNQPQTPLRINQQLTSLGNFVSGSPVLLLASIWEVTFLFPQDAVRNSCGTKFSCSRVNHRPGEQLVKLFKPLSVLRNSVLNIHSVPWQYRLTKELSHQCLNSLSFFQASVLCIVLWVGPIDGFRATMMTRSYQPW